MDVFEHIYKYFWIYLISFIVVILSVFTFFMIRFIRRKHKRLYAEIYMPSGDRVYKYAQLGDKILEYEKENYIISPDAIRREFRKSKYIHFITFLKGIEKPIVLFPSKDIKERIKFYGAESFKEIMETKLIKELNLEKNQMGNIPIGYIIAGIALLGIIIYIGVKMFG